MEFIRINNRKNFLISEVPELHPSSIQHLKYWREQKKRCIEGLWSKDDSDINLNIDNPIEETSKGSWRYMPGNLYFYVNHGIIMHQPEDAHKSAPKKRIRPLLRDIEWEFFYNYLEARGFSGFSDDEEVTCDRSVIEKDEFNTPNKYCYNSKGELKRYVPAREYLRQLHNKPLGLPLFNNEARNLFMLGARGFGKSFMVGVGIILYEILFDGARIYNEESRKNPYKVEVFVGAAIAAKSADLLEKTVDCLNNLPGAWGTGKDYEPAPFYKIMSGSLHPNNMKNAWRHEYEKKVGGSWRKFGTGSNVKHGTYTIENPEAAAGTRPPVMVVEEVGLCPNILTVHGSNTACQLEGTWKFGTTVYLGTGGNVEKVQESEVIFRDPEGFDVLAFEDEWEGTGKIGWFVPAIYGLNQFKDENGNTDIEKALKFKEKVREKKRKSKDPSALSLEMMNYPLIPSEMFLNAKGAMFPQAELKAHLAEVTSNPHRYRDANYYIDLIWDSKGNLKMEHVEGYKAETEFPIKDNKNRPGVIVAYELPKKDANGNVFTNRYLQGTDTYDDDESITTSLGCSWIYDTWTERLVCEYTGRRHTKEFYEITRKMNLFYKAEHNYENNKKGLYSYYDQKNSTHLLCDTPESLRDVADITISKIGNKAKGTTASKPINAYGLRLILDWLTSPAYGEDEDSEILNLHKIRSEGLLKELINFNDTGNFDRISALIMTMILKEDKIKFITKKQEAKTKELAEDPFFQRNFNPNKVTFGKSTQQISF